MLNLRSQDEVKSWVVPLRRRPGPARPLKPCTASASELMFFWQAPLAHVVLHEERELARRREMEVERDRRKRTVCLLPPDRLASSVEPFRPDSAA
jgi:hypothetical protein